MFGQVTVDAEQVCLSGRHSPQAHVSVIVHKALPLVSSKGRREIIWSFVCLLALPSLTKIYHSILDTFSILIKSCTNYAQAFSIHMYFTKMVSYYIYYFASSFFSLNNLSWRFLPTIWHKSNSFFSIITYILWLNLITIYLIYNHNYAEGDFLFPSLATTNCCSKHPCNISLHFTYWCFRYRR